MTIILASKSAARAAILSNAGIRFEMQTADIDERAVEEALEDSGTTPADLAAVLSETKAIDVSERNPNSIVIGADQTLSLDDQVLHKAATMEEARRRLLDLSGKTHQLNSAITLARGHEVLWRHTSVANMTMRDLSPEFIGRHLASVGDKALSSVGCYQYEGEGIQLFDNIDGDYYTIVGLPLLPLLNELRKLGEIDG